MKEIQLTRGFISIVDDCDFDYLSKFSWFSDKDGYARRTIHNDDGKVTSVSMHREILGLVKSDAQKVDHINGIKQDNRRKNLRVCSNSNNNHNTNKMKSNTSGFKGVIWHKYHKKWFAAIRVNGKRKYLGYFSNKNDAAKAYEKAAKELHGDFANFGNGCILLVGEKC